MEIDRKTIKALAADTRLEILKSLGNRRKTPSELSKELDLAVSTITEHLNKLEEAGLVNRKDTGHKWIYYELSDKATGLVKPRYPVQFVLILSLGLIFVFAGVFRYFSIMPVEFAAVAERAPMVAAGEAMEEVTKIIQIDWLIIGLFVAGIILIVISLIIKLRSK